MMKWLNVAELFINLLGSGVIAAGATASRAGIDRVTATAYGGPKVLAVGFWGCQLICRSSAPITSLAASPQCAEELGADYQERSH